MNVHEKLKRLGITMDSFPSLYQEIIELVDKSVLEEREACAKICEQSSITLGDALVIGSDNRRVGINVCENLARKIRSR
jgi:hypothetical protein